MRHSIRWRLAAGYGLIVLASVALMGGLALAFVRRYIERQESEFLRANAAAVARQAATFLAPAVRRRALEELASASAFLGNARVRVLDANRTVLADSGDPAAPDEFLWLVPSVLAEIETEHRNVAPFIVPLPADGNVSELRDLSPLLRDLPLGMSRLYIRRMVTPWGRRFDFEPGPPGDRSVEAAPSPRTVLTVTTPVGDPSNAQGYVELSSPLSFQRETLAAMTPAVVLSGLGALAVAIGLGLVMGRTLTDPLRGLAGAARRMAAGDLSVRATTTRTDELGDLARQFNHMAASLEQSFRDLSAERDSLRRFVADASHELRTPVTSLATFTELLEGPAAEDPSARREFVRESRAQVERLAWIVENLLDLSRLDAGIAALAIEGHDAGDLLSAAAAPHRAAAGRKGISLEARRPSAPISLRCDGRRVELALSNLIANAVKFTQDGGHVEASVERMAGPDAAGEGRGETTRPQGAGPGGGRAMVRFTVRDNGPGIDPADLPRIFERFFRGKNATAEGAGLGLAIARSVATAHGGSVRVESHPGGGSVFCLELPA